MALCRNTEMKSCLRFCRQQRTGVEEERPDDVPCTALLLQGQVTVISKEKVALTKLRGLGRGTRCLNPRLVGEALKGW